MALPLTHPCLTRVIMDGLEILHNFFFLFSLNDKYEMSSFITIILLSLCKI